MRQIRFRFWNKKKKEMLPSSPFYKIDMFNCSFASNLIPLQSTELLDVDGKEIYEGDIVTSHNGVIEGVVKYQAPKFIIQMPKRKSWQEFILAPWVRQFQKVVGNIYQNKEMIIQKAAPKNTAPNKRFGDSRVTPVHPNVLHKSKYGS